MPGNRPSVRHLAIFCAALAVFAPTQAWAGTVGSAIATPATTTVGTPTTVTVTAVITDPTVIPGSVQLQRLDSSSGKVTGIAGTLHDDGLNGDALAGDGTYTLQTTVLQSSPGTVTFRVSAGFQGSLLLALSSPVTVAVTGASVSINILSPANLLYTSTSPVSVSGTVGDPHATVLINGINAPVTGTSFLASVPLVEGLNTLTAVATNTGGAVSTASVQVTLDTTPPHLTIDSPQTGTTTTAASLTVTGTANDIVVGTVNSGDVQVTVNGVTAQVANRTYAAVDVPLSLGVNTIQATGRDRAGNGTTVSATVTRVSSAPVAPSVGAPVVLDSLNLVSGNNQTAAIGTTLNSPLVVALTDQNGKGVAGQSVVFTVTGNNGTLTAGGPPSSSVTATTDSGGKAQAVWTLGQRSGAGIDTVQAASSLASSAVAFTATSQTSGASMIVVDSGNNQSGALGQALAFPFVAVVTDAGHNRVPNVPVTFNVTQGGGTLNGALSQQVMSDTNGRAIVVLTLGTQPGNANNVVQANFPGNPGLPVAFSASGLTPSNPANTTISGVVLDNSNNPIQGVSMRLYLTNQASNNNLPLQIGTPVQTDAKGAFLMTAAPVGYFKLMADGTTAVGANSYPTLEFDIVTVAGQNNTLGGPIYLTALDTVNQLCVTNTVGGTLTLPKVPGFSLTVAPGSATFPGGSKSGCIGVSVVNSDKVPMAPGFGQQPRFIVTIQPVGTIFNPPAPITLPNVDGLKPGAITEMYSYDHDLSMFVAIGTGTVSADGSVIASNPGVGVLKAGWHCGGDPSTSGSAGSLDVELPDSVVVVVGGSTLVTATGSPPLDGVYESWTSDDPSIADFVTSPSCSDQPTCAARLVGYAKGSTTIHVTFRCNTTGLSAVADANVNVVAITYMTFQNKSKSPTPREIDQPYKYIAVYTGTQVTFSFETDPSNATVPTDLINWGGSASGNGATSDITFATSGTQTVTLDVGGSRKAVNIDVVDRPTLSILTPGQIAFAALNPIESAIALAHNLIGNDFIADYLWGSSLEPFVWSESVYHGHRSTSNISDHNGLEDAARHAYWNCLLTMYTDPIYAYGVSYNHEVSGEPSPATETIMDLTNNRSGVQLGLTVPFLDSFSNTACQNLVLGAVNTGSLVYMDSSYGATDVAESALLMPTNK